LRLIEPELVTDDDLVLSAAGDIATTLARAEC
jgi:hypothetical protein